MSDLEYVRYSIDLPFARNPEDPFQLKSCLIKKEVQNKDEVAGALMRLFQTTVENSPRLSWLLTGWDSLEGRLRHFAESGRLVALCIAISKPWTLPEFQGKVEAFPSLEPDYVSFARCISRMPILFWFTYKANARGEAFKLLLETLIDRAGVSIAELAAIYFGHSSWRVELGTVVGLSERAVASSLWSSVLSSQSFCVTERLEQNAAIRDAFAGTSLSLSLVIGLLLPVAEKDWNTVVKPLSAKPIAGLASPGDHHGGVKIFEVRVQRDDDKDAV